MRTIWRAIVDFLFSIGDYPDEPESQRSKRIIFVVASIIATILTIPFALDFVELGQTRLAAVTWVVAIAGPLALVILNLRPLWFAWLVNGIFALVMLQTLYTTALVGGLVNSSFDPANNLIIPLAALMIFGRRAAVFWFAVFVFTVIWAAAIPNFVDPTYQIATTDSESAQTLIGVGIVIMAITLYFVRQRDRFQKESDDLLHNILPDEIATRLKSDTSMIADEFLDASVLFADIVDFTPMSAGMSPSELVGLLNSEFTKFDEFVEQLGLEKIKTVGDEYMVAAGVPLPRPDHAQTIAELAIRIRDHVAINDFDGHRLTLRIGINSGPIVAGIIGTHKFSYDMWGDTVNTASRMESEGVAGSVQVSPATYELVKGTFECEPRGVISVKGKGEMNTYFLLSRRADASVTS